MSRPYHPENDPIRLGLLAIQKGFGGEAPSDPGQLNLKDSIPSAGQPQLAPQAPAGPSPGDMDYWKGRLRQDMQEEDLMNQQMQPLPMGAQTIGQRYA